MASANNQDVAIECEETKVEWWNVHEEGLPNWPTEVKKVLLVQPSSASSERVFSLFSASFNEQQDHAPSDYLQAGVMLQYNAPVNSSCAHPPPGNCGAFARIVSPGGRALAYPRATPGLLTHVVSDSKSKRRRFYRKRPVVCH